MDAFMDLARRRYSLRKFADEPVAHEALTRILEAGRLAPTGCNYQPQRILVLTEEPDLARLDRCTPYRYGAPAALVVCYDRRISWKSAEGHDVGEIDASLVACHMMLEATELGLGTLIICGYDEAQLRRELAIPPELTLVLVLAVGYPAPGAHPSHRLHDVRADLSETVSFASFARPPRDA